MTESEPKGSISGSFSKFKPEIDAAIDEFSDLGVTILAPGKGWLYVPNNTIVGSHKEFRPLPIERTLSVRQIEDSFLSCIKKSDFLYILNAEGYVGQSVSLEIGFAIACGVPVYSKEPIKTDDSYDLWLKNILSNIKVASPKEVRDLFKSGKEGSR